MAYQLIIKSVEIAWVGDGAGAMSVPSAQALFAANLAPIQVPGGDAPTTGNITTACTTAGTNLATFFNASIAQIQGFATGGN